MAQRKPVLGQGGPTLRDVAAAAGVSVWTASTTYSNPGKVAEATRQRVHDAAAALGYLGPHPGARSLARGRTGTIAFVAPGEVEALLADPAAALVARGLLTACDRGGYSMLLSGRASGEMVDGRVFFREAAGADPRVPAIVVDGPGRDGVQPVEADVCGAAAMVAAHLYDLGHRDLAVLAWPGAEERLAGVREGWGGSEPLAVLVLDGGARGAGVQRAGATSGPTPAAGEALARAALTRRPRPTALLALSDTLALSALQAAHWVGLDVPGDVSVAGLDDLPDSAAAGLTSALIPYRPLGERAGDLLTAELAGEDVAAFPELPTALSIRRSTAPPRAGRRN
ncbi:MAG TPA: LacI family DNA-binding transcriptional regulator [Miltoncostaeaceae bacterium]|nr:LacI family DNA-binding transcriptional regulator [Miltoncostaeaceae bacterium]